MKPLQLDDRHKCAQIKRFEIDAHDALIAPISAFHSDFKIWDESPSITAGRCPCPIRASPTARSLRIPCVLMRGGTSRGPFFLERDLPSDPAARDRVLIAAMGSPHRLQVDGIGGGNPLTSKVAIVGAPTHPDADVDYLFAQVSIDRAFVDLGPNCGNMLSAVGPFAIEAGLVPAASRRDDGPDLQPQHRRADRGRGADPDGARRVRRRDRDRRRVRHRRPDQADLPRSRRLQDRRAAADRPRRAS